MLIRISATPFPYRQKLTVFIFLIFFINLSAQNTTGLVRASPESVGVSSEMLDKIGNMLSSAIQNHQIPGAVALVARDGKIINHKAFGTAGAG